MTKTKKGILASLGLGLLFGFTLWFVVTSYKQIDTPDRRYRRHSADDQRNIY